MGAWELKVNLHAKKNKQIKQPLHIVLYWQHLAESNNRSCTAALSLHFRHSRHCLERSGL